MRIRNRRMWAVLVLLLSLAGLVGYAIGRHIVGNHHYHAAKEALEQRDYRQASIHIKKVLKLRPGNLTGRLLAARAARGLGDYEEARQQLQVYQRQGAEKEALALEYKLLDLQQGDHSDVERLLAFCADQLDASETRLILEAIVEGSLTQLAGLVKSGDSPPNRLNPRLSLLLERVKRAIELWNQVCSGKVDRIQGLVWRGQLHNYTNERAKAVADLREALELEPTNFPARYHLALTVAPGNPREAVAHLQVLRQRDPENVQVLFALASGRRGLGQLEEARQLLDEILAAHPDEVSSLFERGLVALDSRQLNEAERWLRKALARKANDPEINHALSRCLRLAGKDTEAALYLDRFQKLEAERQQ